MNENQKENIVAGLVGAFLFSLAGAAIWVVLDMVGFYAGLSGLVGAVCAIQGYRVFGGKLSKKGVIFAAVIALLVLVLAWYACFAKDLYLATQEWYANGEILDQPSYFDCVRSAPYFLGEPEVARGYLLNLAIGVVLAIVGSLRSIINAFKAVQAQPVETAAPVVEGALPNPIPEMSAGEQIEEI